MGTLLTKVAQILKKYDPNVTYILSEDGDLLKVGLGDLYYTIEAQGGTVTKIVVESQNKDEMFLYLLNILITHVLRKVIEKYEDDLGVIEKVLSEFTEHINQSVQAIIPDDEIEALDRIARQLDEAFKAVHTGAGGEEEDAHDKE
uniref:Uncharacterized protein n=1 Tax=Los Azufres archaeal virus 2 TaxID=1425359 RepID=A0A0A0P3T9_9VIRU|nr:hypothetical protein [Los Azufres archaeal virus 2]